MWRILLNIYGGEVPLPSWSVCCLGSINLNKCLDKKQGYVFNWSRFEEYIRTGTRFLDNVIDKSEYPHEKFKEIALKTRPIGLGIMGFADILYKLKIPYNSKEAAKLFTGICYALTATAIETSIEMCSEGKTSIEISNKDDNHFVGLLRYYLQLKNKEPLDELIDKFRKFGIRNSTWTSIAPTGSVAISADCSYSFEPHFALTYEKQLAETNEILTFVNPIFELELDNFLSENGKYPQPDNEYIKQDIYKRIKENKGSCQNIKELPEKIRKVFVTAHDINPIDKLEMQAVGQKYISLGISSTCNLPNSATKEDVENIFIESWRLGLKGITVYRDGCKENQPISFGQKECKESIIEIKTTIEKPVKYERPIRSKAEHFEYNTNYGKLHIEICKDDNDKIFQVLIRIGKQGSLTNMLLDSLSRCISNALQEGVDLSVFAKTLRGNKEAPFWIKLQKEDLQTTQVESIVDLIGLVFQMIIEEQSKENWESPTTIEELYKKKFPIQNLLLELCPNCNEFSISHSLGCKSGQCINPSCGWSSCS